MTERLDPWTGRLSRRSVLRGAAASAALLATSRLAACGSDLKEEESQAGGGSGSGGDKVRIGFVHPETGAVAGFAAGNNYVLQQVRDAFANGVSSGNKKYSVEIITKDTQSDPNRAAQVARELIDQDGVDLILVTSTPETTNPVAEACETNGVPCVSTIVPWEAWFFGRGGDPATGFDYTTCFFFGLNEFDGCFGPMWDRIDTNKTVAGMFPNDPDGTAFRDAYPALMETRGYRFVDGGAYENLTSDFTAQINTFKSNECDIFTCVPLPPDFNNFWRQANQQDYRPKLATVAKVLLFPPDTEALGDLVVNIATDSWWTPTFPYSSSLNGMSSAELAEGFQEATGQQWLQALGSTMSLFEVAQEALGEVDDPHDHDQLAAQLKQVSYEGISGPLDFTAGPVPGVAIQRPVGVQWKRGEDFPYELVVVDNSQNPDVPVAGDLEPTFA